MIQCENCGEMVNSPHHSPASCQRKTIAKRRKKRASMTPDQPPATTAAEQRLREIRELMQEWSSERFVSAGHAPAARSLVANAGLELLDEIEERDAEIAAARAAREAAEARERALREDMRWHRALEAATRELHDYVCERGLNNMRGRDLSEHVGTLWDIIQAIDGDARFVPSRYALAAGPSAGEGERG